MSYPDAIIVDVIKYLEMVAARTDQYEEQKRIEGQLEYNGRALRSSREYETT